MYFLLQEMKLPKPCFGSFFSVTQIISLSGGVLTGVSTVQKKVIRNNNTIVLRL